jgi:hypothetical protein
MLKEKIRMEGNPRKILGSQGENIILDIIRHGIPYLMMKEYFLAFVVECWINYRDIIMIVDGGSHLVTNWT